MTESSSPLSPGAGDSSRSGVPSTAVSASTPPGGLTHLDARGRAQMVDVSQKATTERVAVARAVIVLTPAVRAQVLEGSLAKGEAVAVARVAGIQAAKQTSQLIPLCHLIALDQVEVHFAALGDDAIAIDCTARCRGATGVEMEAMTGAAVAALTLYDMCKAACRGARVSTVELRLKSGGKSGTWQRGES